jgi:eukaryotic-like serine/threonine-protein kinase
MDIKTEIEAIRILEQILVLPQQEREPWLNSQTIEARVADRVRALLRTASEAGEFLEIPVAFDGAFEVPPEMPVPGSRLGAWQLDQQFDAGGMGVVFLAHRADGSYEQVVAIKLVRSGELLYDPARKAQLFQRFEHERHLLARLDHPNIVRILDGGSTDGGIPYLVMEYVDGRPLTDYCTLHKLDIAARINLMVKVCDGVQAAHRHLIIHRDLKPGNILVGADGEPRLLDFGIARLLDGDSLNESATATATVAMTPAYASPEQARHEPLTTASDVYSLGVILYELLVGKRPYALEGVSPAQSERIISETEPPTLRRALSTSDLSADEKQLRQSRIGGDLERIAALALHKDPSRRYESAQAFADDLRRHLQGRPVLAHPDSITYRFGKFVQRHRVGSVAGALAFAAILSAGAIALWQAAEARQSARDTGLVNAFLVDVLSVSNPYASGSEISLAEALDDAAEKVDENFSNRPDLAVDIRYSLGKSMLGRYRLDAAEKQLTLALEQGEQIFGPLDARSIKAIAALASLRKEQNRLVEAKALYDDALARIARSGQTNTELEANILNDYGVLFLIEDDFEHADPILRRALLAGDNASTPPTDDERAQTLGNLAHSARGLGDLDRADALYDQVQAIFERLYPDGGPYLAIVLNNRARLARARKHPEQALAYLQRAVAMHRRSFTGDHVMVLVPMTNLARQSIELGNAGLAAQWAEQSVAMSDRMYVETDHHYHAQALTTLADARLLQARYADASDLIQRAETSLKRLESPHEGSQKYLDDVRARLCTNEAATDLSACKHSP